LRAASSARSRSANSLSTVAASVSNPSASSTISAGARDSVELAVLRGDDVAQALRPGELRGEARPDRPQVHECGDDRPVQRHREQRGGLAGYAVDDRREHERPRAGGRERADLTEAERALGGVGEHAGDARVRGQAPERPLEDGHAARDHFRRALGRERGLGERLAAGVLFALVPA